MKYFYLKLLLIAFPSILLSQHDKKLDSILNVYASQKEDSLKVQTAHTIYDLYYGHKPKLALQYLLEGLKLAEKIDYKKGIAKSYNHKGNHFMITRDIDSSRYYFTKSLKIYNSLNDKHKEGLITYNIIQLSYVTANYEEALKRISENM